MEQPPIKLADLERPSLALARACVAGLPVALVDELAAMLSSRDPDFRYRIVPRSSLARQRASGLLTPDQSDRVVHLARLWFCTRHVSSAPLFRRQFLHGRHGLLGGARPLDIAMASAAGLQLVEELIARTTHGIAA